MPSKTTLTAFSNFCKVDYFAKQIIRSEISSYYVCKNNVLLKEVREDHPQIKKDQICGRVYIVHPNRS